MSTKQSSFGEFYPFMRSMLLRRYAAMNMYYRVVHKCTSFYACLLPVGTLPQRICCSINGKRCDFGVLHLAQAGENFDHHFSHIRYVFLFPFFFYAFRPINVARHFPHHTRSLFGSQCVFWLSVVELLVVRRVNFVVGRSLLLIGRALRPYFPNFFLIPYLCGLLQHHTCKRRDISLA